MTSRGLPSDADQLSRVTEFSIRIDRPLQVLVLAYSSFDNLDLNAVCIVLSILCQNNYIFRSRNVRFGSTSICWRQNVLQKNYVNIMSRHQKRRKIVILASCKRVVLHPLCKTTFPSPGQICKKNIISALHSTRFFLIVLLSSTYHF